MALIALAALLVSPPAPDRVEFVRNLPATKRSTLYVANRAPLRVNPMIKLPVGSIKAKGWLLEYLKRQRNGMTGHLPELSAWLQKEKNAWLSSDGKGSYGWEEVPYWLKGYGNLGYLLGDKKIIAETKTWLDAAIKYQRPNGDFGPDHRFEDGTRDFWGNMLMLSCLQSYYEHSGDKRVLTLMSRYFKYQLSVPDSEFLTGYWQNVRGADNLASVYWLYNRTGEKFLLEFAEKNHRRTMNWAMKDTLPDWHNVNVAQAFDSPAIFFQQSKAPSDLKFAYANFNTMRNLYGDVPGGMFGADENARQGKRDPRQAIETCGMVEQMLSDEQMFAITGDIFWADHCEEVAFNTYPAAVMPDFRGLRYLTSPNQVTADRHNHAPGFQNGGPMSMMNPLSHRCCQHNHSHGWPFFAENLWMATNDHGLVAALYSACTVSAKVGDGAKVTLQVDTKYPFEETVDVRLKLDRASAQFPLYLRVPAWCKAPQLKLNGKSLPVAKVGKGFLKLNRTWSTGDRLTLKLPMELTSKTYKQNHNSVSVNYGPLTFSLKIGERIEALDPRQTALGDSGWQDKIDVKSWPAHEIMPATAWNYALQLNTKDPAKSLKVKRKPWPKSNFPFTLEEVPISITAKAAILPEWGIDRFGLVAELQDGPVKSTQPVVPVELVPMGAARLRISAFPHLSPKGKTWTAAPEPLPYAPTASHCYESDDVRAICDKLVPKSSSDETMPRMTFWPHKGTEEWVAYTFDKEKLIHGIEVYWFDDRGRGGCRVPLSWSLETKTEHGWLEVFGSNSVGLELNKINRTEVLPFRSKNVRLKVKLKDGYSGGILEWRILE